VAAGLGEQQAVAHARLGAGVIVRNGLILGERVSVRPLSSSARA
jgi:hypothetical protein